MAVLTFAACLPLSLTGGMIALLTIAGYVSECLVDFVSGMGQVTYTKLIKTRYYIDEVA